MFSGAHGSGVDVMVAVGVMGVDVGVGGFAVELGGGEAMIITCSQAEISGSITRSIARKNRGNFFMRQTFFYKSEGRLVKPSCC